MNSIESFAINQIRLALMCKKYNASEADTTEKLIVPVLEELYGEKLFFERASRATRGEDSKKWDLQFYDFDTDGLYHTNDRVKGVVECKAVTNNFTIKEISHDGRWNYLKIIKNEWKSYSKNHGSKRGDKAPVSVRDYIQKGFTSAGSDHLLQVWMNKVRYGTNESITLWSNGIVWVVFNSNFFTTGDNPPGDMIFNDKGEVIDAKGNMHIIRFPEHEEPCATTKWCEAFYSLRKLLGIESNGESDMLKLLVTAEVKALFFQIWQLKER